MLEDCKTSRKKNKGVTSVRLLSKKSMAVTMVVGSQAKQAEQKMYAVTMVVVSIRVVKRYVKKCVTKLASNFFKQQRG